MTRQHILDEIRRTALANRGRPLGCRRFTAETGIGYHDWYGKHWARWGEAVREAGFEPNRKNRPMADDYLLAQLAYLTRALGRVPSESDLRLASRRDPEFPSDAVFRRFGRKARRAARVIEYCQARPGHEDVAALWRAAGPAPADGEPDAPAAGAVYLARHAGRPEYVIGRADTLRPAGEPAVRLPDGLVSVHAVPTDDPAGVERYWRRRFAGRRVKGGWFALTTHDVHAFKRWRCIY